MSSQGAIPEWVVSGAGLVAGVLRGDTLMTALRNRGLGAGDHRLLAQCLVLVSCRCCSALEALGSPLRRC
jgi:hypothetical protein